MVCYHAAHQLGGAARSGPRMMRRPGGRGDVCGLRGVAHFRRVDEKSWRQLPGTGGRSLASQPAATRGVTGPGRRVRAQLAGSGRRRCERR
jgi:hypothetical protein